MAISKEEYERRKVCGVCVHCNRTVEGEGVVCNVCGEKGRAYHREYSRERRKNDPQYREYVREFQREYYREYYTKIGNKFRCDKRNAKKRGYSWWLSIDDVSFYYTQPCQYCGDEPNGKLNGIDRQDNSIGYTIENCVPCCQTCNFAKRRMPREEFIWHCNKVAQFNKR